MSTSSQNPGDPTTATPSSCIADFCLIPIGTPDASISAHIADVQRLLRASGLQFSMHSAATTVEGPWEAVMRLIGQAHTMVHEKGVPRVQTDIRVGTRTDKAQSFVDKVTAVERLMAKNGNGEGGDKAEVV